MDREAERGLRSLIEVTVTPPYFQVLGVGKILTLRPQVRGNVRPAHDEPRVEPVVHDVDGRAWLDLSRRTSASHRGGASRPQGHEDEHRGDGRRPRASPHRHSASLPVIRARRVVCRAIVTERLSALAVSIRSPDAQEAIAQSAKVSKFGRLEAGLGPARGGGETGGRIVGGGRTAGLGVSDRPDDSGCPILDVTDRGRGMGRFLIAGSELARGSR